MLDKIAFLFCSIFFGDCFYISIVEHPARMVCPIPYALKQWRNSYPRAAKIQVFLSLVGSILATISYFSTGQSMWLMAALFLFVNFKKLLHHSTLVYSMGGRQLSASENLQIVPDVTNTTLLLLVYAFPLIFGSYEYEWTIETS